MLNEQGIEGYIIRIDANFYCTCYNPVTNENDETHIKCFGTGKKIEVVKTLLIRTRGGTARYLSSEVTNQLGKVNRDSAVFYVSPNVIVHENDMIIIPEPEFNIFTIETSIPLYLDREIVCYTLSTGKGFINTKEKEKMFNELIKAVDVKWLI